MAQVDMSVALKSSAARVWDLVGGFQSLPQWHPAVAASHAGSEGGRTLRRLTLKGGGEIVEALERHDDAARSCAYTIVSGPLPVADYHSELRVIDSGAQSCTVRWSSRFAPKGVPEADAVSAISGIYQAGFDALKARFGG